MTRQEFEICVTTHGDSKNSIDHIMVDVTLYLCRRIVYNTPERVYS